MVVNVNADISGYSYYQKINITGNSVWSGDQTNYPIELNLYNSSGISVNSTIFLNGHLQRNRIFQDILLTDSTNSTQYPFFVIDYNLTWARVAFNITTIPKTTNETTYYLYYGNPSATDRSSGPSVYPQFDSFGYNLNNIVIYDQTNPTITAAQLGLPNAYAYEFSILQDPTNPNTIDIWTSHGITGNMDLYYSNTTSSDMKSSLVNTGKIKDTAAAYNYVTYDPITSKWYMFLNNYAGHKTGSGNIYLYNSTDKINWNIMNGGNPVLTESSVPTDQAYAIYNIA
ncbi:MAG: DUF2341 domain-containing protein, partial [Bacteroidales bacterium]|nr:DUF2341 domain-containing protein [Bacteroidales bacterium]